MKVQGVDKMSSDLRLCHSKKIISKKNISYVNDLCKRGTDNFIGPIITLDLTCLCNYACPHCIDKSIVKSKEENINYEMNYEKITSLLLELRSVGARNIELTGGGEPTLFSRFDDFCRYVYGIGYSLALVTNGSYLHHYFKLFKEIHFSWVRVSLDAGTAQTYSKLHGVREETFKEVIYNMERISQYTNLGISYIICNTNANELKKAYILASEVGAKYFEVKPMRSTKNNEVLEESHSLMVELNKLKEEENSKTKIISPVESLNMKHILGQRCWASDLRTVLTPGGMYRCTYMRGKEHMPLPQNVEEFIRFRNILNNDYICNGVCLFCTRLKLNEAVNSLLKNPQKIEEIMCNDEKEEIEDAEWI